MIRLLPQEVWFTHSIYSREKLKSHNMTNSISLKNPGEWKKSEILMVSESSAEAQLQFATQRYRLYRRTDHILYCQKKTSMLPNPTECSRFAIKGTSVRVHACTSVCSYREFFLVFCVTLLEICSSCDLPEVARKIV